MSHQPGLKVRIKLLPRVVLECRVFISLCPLCADVLRLVCDWWEEGQCLTAPGQGSHQTSVSVRHSEREDVSSARSQQQGEPSLQYNTLLPDAPSQVLSRPEGHRTRKQIGVVAPRVK